MKDLTLNFAMRVKLIGMLRAAQAGGGGYEKLDAMLGIFSRVKFTEDELAEITVFGVSETTAAYQVKDGVDQESFSLALRLEDSHAAYLRQELDAYLPRATFDDLEWMRPLKEQLDARPKMPSAPAPRRRKG